jgi:L-iditol 2-dehydrogenase
MTRDNTKSAVLFGPKDLRIESRSVESPKEDEVQIKVTHTGICGSDLHYFYDGKNGPYEMKHPFTLGHEAAGRVIEVGSNVSDFKVGDPVALEVGVACLKCDICTKRKLYNLCPDLHFRGSAKSYPHYEGTLSEVVNHPARWCHIIPPGIKDLALGALAEPLSVAMQAIQKSKIEQETIAPSVLVVGAGTIGQLVAFAAKKAGAQSTVICDISDTRVNFALDSGFADSGVVLKPVKRADNAALANVEQVRNATGKSGFDHVFECTSVELCVQMAYHSTNPGATITLVGMGSPQNSVPLSQATVKELTVVAVFRYANTYPKALELLDKEQEALQKVVTHRFPLDSAVEAFKAASKPVDDDGKLLVKAVICAE